MDTYIKATADFTDLLQKVTDSLNIGKLVSTNEAVLQQTIVVANQLSKRINTNTSAQARYLPVDLSVFGELPYTLIDSFTGSVKIIGNPPSK